MCRRLKLSRTNLISKVAGIDLILERFDQQDRVYADFRGFTAKRLESIDQQVAETNGAVADLKEKEIRRTERERIVKGELDNRGDNRRAYWGAGIGAGAVGAVTILLHIAGVA